MAKATRRNHNEWVQPVARKKCSCEEFGKKAKGNQVFALGEYHSAKWRTVCYFCQECFPSLLQDLKSHVDGCGCSVTFVPRSGCSIPDWIRNASL